MAFLSGGVKELLNADPYQKMTASEANSTQRALHAQAQFALVNAEGGEANRPTLSSLSLSEFLSVRL